MWSDEIPLRTARGFGPAAVTPHELSTMAAIEIMSRGGNAVDGAIAANAVQGTVAPETCGVGGDLFALVYHPQKGNPPACLNSSGRAGSGADASSLRQAGHRTMPEKGPPSVTVPGCVDGWYALSERFGRRPLAEVLGPAIRLAENGFAVSRELSEAWAANATQLLTQASASPMFPDGRPPRLGESITRPYLAETLRSVISGRDSFYLDRLGTEIPQATDHLITKEDLARCQADWVDPWSVDVFGKTVWTTPPNSQGYLTLASLWIFEHLEVPPDLDSPDYWQGLIEAYRSMAWERDQALHDPQTGPPPTCWAWKYCSHGWSKSTFPLLAFGPHLHPHRAVPPTCALWTEKEWRYLSSNRTSTASARGFRQDEPVYGYTTEEPDSTWFPGIPTSGNRAVGRCTPCLRPSGPKTVGFRWSSAPEAVTSNPSC